MGKVFQRLFGRRVASDADPSPASSTSIGANALDEGEETAQEYKEFCQTFYFKPGQLLVDYLSAEKVTRVLDWFHPDTPEPEPKAFIRLANAATREGEKAWEKTSLKMFVHGLWRQGGGPSQNSQNCLSVLSQVLEIPITIYYRPSEDAEMMVMIFEP